MHSLIQITTFAVAIVPLLSNWVACGVGSVCLFFFGAHFQLSYPKTGWNWNGKYACAPFGIGEMSEIGIFWLHTLHLRGAMVEAISLWSTKYRYDIFIKYSMKSHVTANRARPPSPPPPPTRSVPLPFGNLCWQLLRETTSPFRFDASSMCGAFVSKPPIESKTSNIVHPLQPEKIIYLSNVAPL